MTKNYCKIKRKYYSTINNENKILKTKKEQLNTKEGIRDENIENTIKLQTLSSFKNNYKKFSKLAHEAYIITDSLCREYPNYFEWYWTKELPRVLNNKGEIIICTINNNVVGVAFLKKDNTERKICTLLVIEKYRGKHIATKILEKSFEYLGTTKPLATIAEYKFPMYEKIIQKYNWKLTQKIGKGHYNNISGELVYNGKINE